jgi:hypothetical protein
MLLQHQVRINRETTLTYKTLILKYS